MHQSRLVAAVSRSYRSLSSAYNQARVRGFATEPTGRAVDPDVYSIREHEIQPAVPKGRPEEMKEKYEPETGKQQIEAEREAEFKAAKETEPLAPPEPPLATSTRLESTGVHNPAEPVVQQKRKNSTAAALEETSCSAGLDDGTPWPKDDTKRGQQEEDDKDYYKHHKASPLSEIKMVDTRKPITRETDGTVREEDVHGIRNVIGWLPEQLDTAEEALERARRIFRENAMRGDPDSPHGRVLRVLRGEWF